MNSELTFADFFAGCGGLSYGFNKNPRYKEVFATDSWAAARDTYLHNVPDSNFMLLDMHEQSGIDTAVRECVNKVDIVIGGPPCQGFSTLGKRALECRLSSLVDVYLDVAVKINPKIIVMENVRGITSKKHPSGITYKQYIHDFFEQKEGIKYDFTDFLVDCADFGLAQTRIRYLLVAFRKDINLKGCVLEGFLNSIQKQKSSRRTTLKDVIGDLPVIGACEGSDEMAQTTSNGRKRIYNHKAMNHSALLQKRLSYVPKGGGLPDVPEELLTPHLKKMLNGSYGSGGHIKNIYGRLRWDDPCGTIVAGMDKITCGRFVHPDQNRLLTPRECARIQSFPDDFRFLGGSVTQYYLVGNAVPPRLSEVISNAILDGFAAAK